MKHGACFIIEPTLSCRWMHWILLRFILFVNYGLILLGVIIFCLYWEPWFWNLYFRDEMSNLMLCLLCFWAMWLIEIVGNSILIYKISKGFWNIDSFKFIITTHDTQLTWFRPLWFFSHSILESIDYQL